MKVPLNLFYGEIFSTKLKIQPFLEWIVFEVPLGCQISKFWEFDFEQDPQIS
jgi:hypothetical protein